MLETTMADDKHYDGLRELDQNVLDEVVREGDATLDAQLQIATAADQRATTTTPDSKLLPQRVPLLGVSRS